MTNFRASCKILECATRPRPHLGGARAEYPLILTLSFDVRCPEFFARVSVHGRALMAIEDGAWWCHGVDPGGLTANGSNPAEAYSAYKMAFFGILNDLAEDAGSFESFKLAVDAFVADVDRHEAERWQTARVEIRAGTAVAKEFTDLKRVTDTVIATARVTSLDRVSVGEEDVQLAESADRAA